jgi:apolipoprotein N-acyltransferase
VCSSLYGFAFPFPGRRGLLACLSVPLLVLSFPPYDLAFLAWVALIPLLIAVHRQYLRRAFVYAFLTGSSFFMGLCSWANLVPGFTWIDFTVCGVYLGAYVGLFGGVCAFLSQRTRLPLSVTVPPVWVSTEYLRSHAGFLGVPWGLLGHSQYLNIPLIQIASITGVYGVSFLIVLVNAALSDFLLSWAAPAPDADARSRSRLFAPAAVSVCLLGMLFLYGFRALATQSRTDVVTVTVLQGNIPQDLKGKAEFHRLSLDTHVKLTRDAANAGPTSLVVWPETSVYRSLTQDLYTLNTLSALLKETNTYLLIGSFQRPKFGSREFRKRSWFNSASLISPTRGIVEQYHKTHLFPFGEYLPYKEFLPWPSRVAAITKASDILLGEDYTVFDLDGRRFSVLICWESLFPELVRRFVEGGAQFLINITNEAWFGESAAPYQFMAMNVFRAVENRISVVRSANTGISGFIDPYGRISGKVKKNDKDIFVAGYLTREILLRRQTTFYTQYGDLWAYLNLIVTFFLLSVAFFKGRLKEGDVALNR